MLVSYFNKCVIMRLLVKLNIAADLTLFPECTIIIKINIINNQAEFFRIYGMPLREGGHPPLAPSPYGGCGHIVRWLCRLIYAIVIILDQQTPLLKILRTGLKCEWRRFTVKPLQLAHL